MEKQTFLLGALMPHPAILLPGIDEHDREKVMETVAAMRSLAKEMVQLQPDLVVLISPHGPMFEDAVSVMGGIELKGNLQEFGSDLQFQFKNDEDAVLRISEAAKNRRAPIYVIDEQIKQDYEILQELDYGAMVPLYFLREAGFEGSVLHLSPGIPDALALYFSGICVRHALHGLGKRVVVVASGDNSHALTAEGPFGFRQEGLEFDRKLHQGIRSKDWVSLMMCDQRLRAKAMEDCISSCTVMLGMFDRDDVDGELLSYQCPFGVGYTVARFLPRGKSHSLLERIREEKKNHLEHIRQRESSLVKLARLALETYIREQRVITPPDWVEEQLIRHSTGCYISIKQNGQLRGCIGTVLPEQANLAEEIIANSIASGTEDDRYFPVDEDELMELVYSVDVIGEVEPITSEKELDPNRFGLLVVKGERSGLLLPELSGVDTVKEQITYAKEKAGIEPHDQMVEMYRFSVKRFT